MQHDLRSLRGGSGNLETADETSDEHFTVSGDR
jgi:hypothetical protein